MNIVTVHWKNYRNLTDGGFRPCSGVNVIYGENAQGKTNLLEALWIGTGGRSFRGARDEELIAFGKHQTRVQMDYRSLNREHEIDLILGAEKEGGAVRRKYQFNGVAQKSSADMVGRFCACVFAPVHLSLVEAGPAERRKFLDGAVCQARIGSAVALSRYRKALEQRNALLKNLYHRPYYRTLLEEWDESLVQLGGCVIHDRMEHLAQLQPAAEEFYFGISGGKERLSLQYESTVPLGTDSSLEGITEAFRRCLYDTRQQDEAAGFTTCGPHRDDFAISINGLPARNFGSQGQKRSAALALKLGEASVLQLDLREKPVVLFDDVMSELDSCRQDYLFNHMKNWQIFITCCEPAAVLRLAQGKCFRMENGRLTEE